MKWLLAPFAVLYYLITSFRNHTYNVGIKKSIRFGVPVISVGNLSMGGTGKTPHIEYLIRLLKDTYQVATLSRGYKRKTKGFFLANEDSTALEIGDEPMQFHQKFGDEVVVAVGEERAVAIPSILLEREETNVILLDDAFQHRPVSPHYSILLTDYSRLFFEDWVIPIGRLREARKGAKRSDIVVITKCPTDLSTLDQERIQKEVLNYTKSPVFFSTIAYQEPKAIFEEGEITEKVIVLTGIAKNQPFIEKIKENHTIVEVLEFPDHHQFKEEDCQKILETYNHWSTKDKVSILTTEKDMMRLSVPQVHQKLQSIALFYLPIEVRFLNRAEEFNQLITNKIQDIHND